MMSPEEKSLIIAETEKLKLETIQLQKGGWGKPSSWIPMLVAFSAIMTSYGQFQYSAIKEKESALYAREKVLEAREYENRLKIRNKVLETKVNDLLSKIKSSKKKFLSLKEKIEMKNLELLVIAKEKGGELESVINLDVESRKTIVKEIYQSITEKGFESELKKFISLLDNEDKQIRSVTLDKLVEKYKSNSLAISLALEYLGKENLELISTNGIINVINFLQASDLTLWDESMINQAFIAVHSIKKMGESDRIHIGKTTEKTLQKFSSFLNMLSKKQ